MIRVSPIVALLVLSLLTAFGRSAKAQDDSRVWIEGTSTVNSFTCESDSIEGSGLLSGSRLTAVEVTVDTLDCGDKRMNKDMRTALRSEEHPVIRFDVSRVGIEDAGSDRFSIQTTGSIAIAGAVQPVSLTLEGHRQPDGDIRITGNTELKLSSFGIKRPTALLGLVKVHDRVVVHFDLAESAVDAVAFGRPL